MPSYRIAIRRTQKQVDAAAEAASSQDYRALQERAKAAGIPARQSADALREALKDQS